MEGFANDVSAKEGAAAEATQAPVALGAVTATLRTASLEAHPELVRRGHAKNSSAGIWTGCVSLPPTSFCRWSEVYQH